MRKIILPISFLCISLALVAQPSKGFVTMPLNDMSSFRQQDGNWRIVGDITIDRETDIHDKIPVPPAAPVKKGKKQPVAEPAFTMAQPVTTKEGTGILLNMNDEKKKSNLLTVVEHGDIELELELMVPKGSNSGVYLQGRYEVQILDSWGVKSPKYGDIGGIYRNWENKPGEIYMGKAPLSNPAKAPGLWQKFKIVFQAPRFDANGKKIANAKFISVELNGIKIHDNLEVPLATGGPIDKAETAQGPLMIQGDHGPVAFRNIRYKLLREIKPSISPIAYKIFHGHYKVFSDFINQKPFLTGTNPTLTCEVVDIEDAYGVVYSGTITIPEDGPYDFGLAYTGGARLIVNGKQIIERQRNDSWPLDIGNIELKAGTYPFEIANYKDAGWMPPRLAFYVRGEGSKEISLHDFNSYPPDENPVSSIFLNPTSGPRMLRAFVDFKGDGSRRLTHTIGVGEPSGINYVYDMKSGNLACVWRGGFVDATPMWHERGDGSFKPMGAAEFTFYNQPLAYLKNPNDPFPVLSNEEEYTGKGYEIEATTGRPIFKYVYKGLEVTSKITPDASAKYFDHEVIIKDRGTESKLYYKLGEGKLITQMPDGSFAIDDKRYYIKVHSGITIVRLMGDVQELLASFDSATLKYSIIW